ncbi:MAG: ABC transporter permease [Mangrovibacterium sp.]
MNKALLILQREYLTRVRKKSFIITTLLVPLAFAALIGFSTWMSLKGSQEEQTVAVFDETGLFLNRLKETELIHFAYIPREVYQQYRAENSTEAYHAMVYIPHNVFAANQVQIFSKNQVPRSTLSAVKEQLEHLITGDKRAGIFEKLGQPDLERQLAAANTRIRLDSIKLNDDGTTNKVSTEINTIVGFLGGFIIYMMIFMYGSMVMRGVAEEKTNRISEVLVSSVKPMPLLFGKIVGIGLVGITQFIIWVVLLAVVLGISSSMIMGNAEAVNVSQNIMASSGMNNTPIEVTSPHAMSDILSSIHSLNLPLILVSFLVFFILGYLLYAAIMGAIGSAVSSDEDAQQLVSIVALPLVMAIIMVTPVADNPHSTLAFWSSMFPLFSPVCMMVRIPAGIPWWELGFSLVLLLATTFGCVWAAAKIYRTGILMYGKKVNMKELWKWLKY